MIYLQLFLSFLKIGLFGFGGGLAIISLIQHEVESHGWMTQEEFVDIVAVSQVTPGPIGINCATYVGYTATGSVWGSVLTTLAIIIPSLVIMLLICKVYFVISTRFQRNIYFTRTMRMLRFAVLGLIAAAALCLMTPVSFIDWRSWVIFAITCILTILPQFIKTPDSNTNPSPSSALDTEAIPTPATKKSAAFLKTTLHILSHPIVLIVLAGIAGYVIYL